MLGAIQADGSLTASSVRELSGTRLETADANVGDAAELFVVDAGPPEAEDRAAACLLWGREGAAFFCCALRPEHRPGAESMAARGTMSRLHEGSGCQYAMVAK
jgi:hypothetical protein